MRNETERPKPRPAPRIRDYRAPGVNFQNLPPDADGPTVFRYIINNTEQSPDEYSTDERFEEKVLEVEGLFLLGRISVEEAAKELDLTTREFLAEFVFDGIEDRDEREILINNAVDAFEVIKVGRSIRQFISETILGNVDTLDANDVQRLPANSLGVALRQALSVGCPLTEFVEEFIFNKEWQTACGKDDQTVESLVTKTVSELESAEEYLFNASWFSAMHVRDKEISERTLDRIAYNIAKRRFRPAKEMLEELDNRQSLVSPRQRNGAILLNLYAQWIDFDFSYISRVEEAVAEFRRQPLHLLSRMDSAHLDIAEGLVKLHNENYDEAIVHFKYAMRMAHSLKDDDSLAICLYFLSRSYWKKGVYRRAMHYVSRAKKRNEELARPERGAAIELLEAWLLLLLGDLKTAVARWSSAKKVLMDTDDYTNHGNVLSFEGRLHQATAEYPKDALDEKTGRLVSNEESVIAKYVKALKAYDKAIWAYRSADCKHRNIARTYINMADVRFLMARKIASDDNGSTRESRAQVLELRLQAFEDLDAAEKIYLLHPERNHRGFGKIHNMRACLYEACGEFEHADAETKLAYSYGSQKNDHLLMGQAKKNEFAAMQGKSGTGDSETDEAVRAFASAEEALYHANETNNPRLQARCHIYLGHSVLQLDQDYVRAEECYAEAKRCLEDSKLPHAKLSEQEPWKSKLELLKEEIEKHKQPVRETALKVGC